MLGNSNESNGVNKNKNANASFVAKAREKKSVQYNQIVRVQRCV
jgi:hypothetical protein